MAVTAHWIESKTEVTPNGIQHSLKLRADLIGFHHMPGHHSGEHLAHAFMFVLNRLDITSKVVNSILEIIGHELIICLQIGWITLDNASNNDTLLTSLERTFKSMNIPFSHIKNRIRCFPHIVNLACQAVLTSITNTEFAKDDPNIPEYVPAGPPPESFLDALERDPVATVRALVRNVSRNSSMLLESS